MGLTQELSLTNARNRAYNWNLVFKTLSSSKKIYRHVFDRLLPFHCSIFYSLFSCDLAKKTAVLFLLADVHIYPRLFPLMSSGPDKPSLMFIALGWDPRKCWKDLATPAGTEKDAELP